MKAQRFIPLLVVAAAGLLAYQNSFRGELIHDDVGSILENPTIRHLWPIWQPLSPPHRHGLTVEGRPLINLSLAINYALGRYHVRGYHVFNLTVHLLAGLTLLGIVRRTLLQPALRERFGAAANELALVVALLWTLHPLQSESVAYIIQRAESIMGLFYLLTLYCFIRGVESRRPHLWYLLSVTACALGMASKEVMVSAPVMVLLYDRAFLSGSLGEAWRRRRWLYLGLGSSWILLGYLVVWGQLPGTLTIAKRVELTGWEYLATQPGVILHYLRLCVWPHPLGFDFYGWPIARSWRSIVPPTVVVAVLLAASAGAWRKQPVWGFVGAWFFLILAPSSSFIPLHEVIYEHRMYLPLAAIVSVAVLGLYAVAGRRSLAVWVAAAVGLGFLTWQRNQDYRNDVAMRAEAVARLPHDARAHYNLGLALGGAGRPREAIAQYEEALRLNPNMAEVHASWGLALSGAGRVQEAIDQYKRALQINPNYAEAHNNLGSALREMGKVPEAIAHWEQAVRINPDCAEAHNNLANILREQGKIHEAIWHFEQALRVNPDIAETHNNLGVALEQAGRVPEAIEHYEQALRINPDDAQAHNSLGLVLIRLGNVQAAIGQWEQALRIKSDYVDAHNNLGSALAQLGRVPEAVGHWEQALRTNPDYPEAHYNLGVILEQAGRAQEAIEQYEQAVRIKPDYAKAQDGLARLRAAR